METKTKKTTAKKGLGTPNTKKKLTTAERNKAIMELSRQANRNIAYRFMFDYFKKEVKN